MPIIAIQIFVPSVIVGLYVNERRPGRDRSSSRSILTDCHRSAVVEVPLASRS